MKKFTQHAISFLMVLTLCIGMLSGISFSVQGATVNYVYSSDNYILNWGTREEVATFLSQNAVAFYEKNDTSYDELSALSGSGNINTVPQSELYKELQDLMKDNHKRLTSYGDTRYMFQSTDCQNSCKTSDKISSLYSGSDIGPAWDAGATWNREHTWPKSKTAYKSVSNSSISEATDIMTLRPSDSNENSSRLNKAYGEQTNSTFFNPNHFADGKYDLRGDCARMMLYTYVRWGNTGYMWGGSGVVQSRDVLLKWIEEDPVDTWELGRNDSVESITGTRNVFVDYPELIFILLGEEVPADYTTPSGEAKNTSSVAKPTVKPTVKPTANPNNQGTNNPTQAPDQSGSTNTSCSHAKAYTVEGEAPRCEVEGFSAGVYCPDCKKYISGHGTLDALGHDYSSDCDTTCSRCTVTRQVSAEHNFADGTTCTLCGEQKPANAGSNSSNGNEQKEENGNNQENSNGWIIPVIIGAVLVIGAAVVVIVERKKIFKCEKNND
ncbi:MAG: endonuclease [Clostridia bacterium]|nr:endonuclease [Clostridia bacterium]